MLWAGTQLAKRKEERKLLFVLTDGQPESQFYRLSEARNKTRVIKTQLDQVGIETCGIGIKIDVSWVFDRHLKIDALSELPNAMFSLMQSALIRKAA